MDTAKPYHGAGVSDVYMQTAKGYINDDVRMDTAKPGSGGLGVPGAGGQSYRPPPLKEWERGLVDSPEVKRKATVAQLCAFISMLDLDLARWVVISEISSERVHVFIGAVAH